MRFERVRAKLRAVATVRTGFLILAGALAIGLAGCSANTRVYTGTPVVTLTTDAADAFSTYIVGIGAIDVTEKNGTVYPISANYVSSGEYQADLTRRVNLTELLGVSGVPVGTYTSMTIEFDYSDPTIYLLGATSPAKVESTSGTSPPGIISVTVKFAPNHPLVVSLNQSIPVAIDIDLAASDSIDAATNTVTVLPYAVATVEPVDTNPIRARGEFVLDQASKGDFVENIRPFDDTYYGDSGEGALTVDTNSNTYFNFNGHTYVGSAGLAALASAESETVMTAYGSLGSLTSLTPTFNATAVYGGSSVITQGTEGLRGTVAARSGDTLTLERVQFVCPENLCQASTTLPYAEPYFPTATVTLGPSTVVSEDGVAASDLGIQSISVGQRVSVTGAVSGSTTGTTLTLSATHGQVRIQPTTIWGTLLSGSSASATLDLQQIGLEPLSTFNFSGTGVTGSEDASPANYLIDTGTTDESGTASGTLLQATGFMSPFGSAPPDFTASSIAPASAGPTDLIVQWKGGTTAPFSSSGSSGLVVNLGNSSIESAIMETGPQTVQLASLAASPTIAFGCASGSNCGNAEFGVGNGTNGISTFDSTSSFLSALSSTLDGSTGVATLVAIGTYDSANNTFYTQRIDIVTE
jgi:DNA-binding transcriptional regulator YdaS (Cro superfamily)